MCMKYYCVYNTTPQVFAEDENVHDRTFMKSGLRMQYISMCVCVCGGGVSPKMTAIM